MIDTHLYCLLPFRFMFRDYFHIDNPPFSVLNLNQLCSLLFLHDKVDLKLVLRFPKIVRTRMAMFFSNTKQTTTISTRTVSYLLYYKLK